MRCFYIGLTGSALSAASECQVVKPRGSRSALSTAKLNFFCPIFRGYALSVRAHPWLALRQTVARRWRKRQAELARRRAPTTPQPIFSSAKGTRTSVETQRSKSSFCVFHIRPMPEETLLKAPRIVYFPTHTQPLAVCLPPRRQRCADLILKKT